MQHGSALLIFPFVPAGYRRVLGVWCVVLRREGQTQDKPAKGTRAWGSTENGQDGTNQLTCHRQRETWTAPWVGARACLRLYGVEIRLPGARKVAAAELGHETWEASLSCGPWACHCPTPRPFHGKSDGHWIRIPVAPSYEKKPGVSSAGPHTDFARR